MNINPTEMLQHWVERVKFIITGKRKSIEMRCSTSTNCMGVMLRGAHTFACSLYAITLVYVRLAIAFLILMNVVSESIHRFNVQCELTDKFMVLQEIRLIWSQSPRSIKSSRWSVLQRGKIEPWDVVITAVQTSPPSSTMSLYLCSTKTKKKLILLERHQPLNGLIR